MRTLFKIWLGLTIVSLVFYLPVYIFSNNALNAVEEITPDYLIPLTGYRGQDPERKHNILVATGIDTSMALEDALDDNESLSNVSFQYMETEEAKQTELATGLKIVEATADIDNGRQMKLVFTVIPKRFLKSHAEVNGFLGLKITDGKYALDVVEGPSDELYLWALFDKSRKAAPESVQRMNNRFDLMVAEIQERERARERDQNPPAVATQQPADSQNAIEYFQNFLNEQKGGEQAASQAAVEPAQVEPQQATAVVPHSEAPLPQDLGDQQPVVPAQAAPVPTRQIESNTVAGNPSPDKIIIFQWEGQPAYCADEGIDGANCRGDGSSWIGQGTYKDYMDPGSPICIAGEPGCKLPEFFPADIRG
ncbi:hypothetical protein D9M69_376070 [compost metagenome]